MSSRQRGNISHYTAHHQTCTDLTGTPVTRARRCIYLQPGGLRLQLAALEREEFTALFLDNQHRLIAHETLFTGTINHTQVHPREVIKAALRYNAAAIVLSHNHPSGYAEPSHADRLLTDHLKQALKLVDIRLLDHLVVGGMDIVSFAERGWL